MHVVVNNDWLAMWPLGCTSPLCNWVITMVAKLITYLIGFFTMAIFEGTNPNCISKTSYPRWILGKSGIPKSSPLSVACKTSENQPHNRRSSPTGMKLLSRACDFDSVKQQEAVGIVALGQVRPGRVGRRTSDRAKSLRFSWWVIYLNTTTRFDIRDN